MSAPTPAPGDDRPREGYYPDPSIPGYVRYWNGVAWVPGTSRPAPTDGTPPAPPSSTDPAGPSVEETGPHFFDEDPVDGPGPANPAGDQHGSRPEPASAWGAERSRQSGFGGDQDRRVAWGGSGTADPRIPLAGTPDGRATSTDGTATFPPAATGSRPGADAAPSESTMAFRALSPRTGEQGDSAGAADSGAGQPAAHTPSAQAPQAAAPTAPAAGASVQQPAASLPQQPAGSLAQRPAASLPQQSTGPAAPSATGPGAPSPTGPATPMTTGAGGGQPSWAQQVHQLASAGADGDRPPAPWKPPVEDPFLAAVREQAAARPAGLGKRLAARLLDTLIVGAVTGVAAVPLAGKAIDHINGKIDAARLSGRTVTVWLLDGTTSVYLAIVLAVLLGFGVLYEVLPTVRWGRTLGKKLCGLEVRDIEGHEPPAFGPALRRWLVYSVPGLLGVGVVGILWCLFDRPWRQCWHDKAAHTFVAG
ncbi:RDD family protein [Streptomyces glomeratus]|uniref:RDD family protein n=1 Tax=Streptomyces glomeratus TaxID=284452 RepID=A0ABP6LSJ5_9ACTN|nr:RDD family protein [Streptomyces glomeratus]MCF1510266.1 RDD family protein [Streptomyces glomeratus]